MVNSIAELKVGDVAYVLSGRQNSFFPVEVTKRDEGGVEVYLQAKREHQWYYTDGRADAEAIDDDGLPRATLVPVDDWRLGVLKQRKDYKKLHQLFQTAITVFYRDPTPENMTTMFDSLMSWRDFVRRANPLAIRSESIPEYLELRSKQ
jgi:hypothetical protein